MTNEEARRILIQDMESLKANPLVTVDNCLYEALDMAIQALEQGDVLDKIRAEINSHGSIWVGYKIIGHTDRDIENIVENVLKQAKKQVLDIIDKYKVESEVMQNEKDDNDM